MVLLEEYYELREAEKVSSGWRVIQVILYITASVLSLFAGVIFTNIYNYFDNNCYLYGNISLLYKEDGEITIDVNLSTYSTDYHCDFSQYVWICSFIFGCIWCTFFIMCGKGGKATTGLTQPWRIVIPAMIFNCIYFIISLTAAIITNVGTNQFCYNFDVNKNKTLSNNSTCDGIQSITDRKGSSYIVTYINIISILAYLITALWFLTFLILLFRLIFVTDFQLFKVSVYKTLSGQSGHDDSSGQTGLIEDLSKPSTSKGVQSEPYFDLSPSEQPSTSNFDQPGTSGQSVQNSPSDQSTESSTFKTSESESPQNEQETNAPGGYTSEMLATESIPMLSTQDLMSTTAGDQSDQTPTLASEQDLMPTTAGDQPDQTPTLASEQDLMSTTAGDQPDQTPTLASEQDGMSEDDSTSEQDELSEDGSVQSPRISKKPDVMPENASSQTTTLAIKQDMMSEDGSDQTPTNISEQDALSDADYGQTPTTAKEHDLMSEDPSGQTPALARKQNVMSEDGSSQTLTPVSEPDLMPISNTHEEDSGQEPTLSSEPDIKPEEDPSQTRKTASEPDIIPATASTKDSGQSQKSATEPDLIPTSKGKPIKRELSTVTTPPDIDPEYLELPTIDQYQPPDDPPVAKKPKIEENQTSILPDQKITLAKPPDEDDSDVINEKLRVSHIDSVLVTRNRYKKNKIATKPPGE